MSPSRGSEADLRLSSHFCCAVQCAAAGPYKAPEMALRAALLVLLAFAAPDAVGSSGLASHGAVQLAQAGLDA